MDEQQQQRVNQAAEQFANAIKDSYQTMAGRGVSTQEMNAQLTQEFFNRVIENLRTQAEDTRQMGQQLADQQQRATEAGRTLTQESVSAYIDLTLCSLPLKLVSKQLKGVPRGPAGVARAPDSGHALSLLVDKQNVKGSGS